jgi:trans-aconitate 2-methyltransferase
MKMDKNITYQWDATTYASHSTTQQTIARELISKMNFKGNESLLDIGCGDGKVTMEFAELLPEGRVLGVDNSDEMIAHAKSLFPPSSFPNLDFQQADATQLSFDQRFDIVFSNAALHWIIDHRPVIKGIYELLKPKGGIYIQTGAQGNAWDVLEVAYHMMEEKKWRCYFQEFSFPYGFYSPEDYEPWLEEAGFKDIYIDFIENHRVHKDLSNLKGWIRTTWQPYLYRIPDELREAFIEQLSATYLQKHPKTQKGDILTSQKVLKIKARKL